MQSDLKVPQGQPAQRERMELTAQLDHKVPQAPPVLSVQPVQSDLPARMERTARLDHKVRSVPSALLVPLVQTAPMALLDRRVPQAQPVL